MELRPSFLLLTGCLLLVGLAGCTAPARSETRPEWKSLYAPYGAEGCFVLLDEKQNLTYRSDSDCAAERFLPASTYKILNALIALESGTASGPDFELTWDGTYYPIDTWNRNQTLKSAMQNSVVWYYQELARREGAETIQKYLTASAYGNQNMGGPIDSFWLEGDLRISADEQITFLQKLVHNQLPFSAQNMAAVRSMILVEETPTYRLYAKTGWATRQLPQVGWYVGYLEENGQVYYFANTYHSSQPGSNFGDARLAVTRLILNSLGLLKP